LEVLLAGPKSWGGLRVVDRGDDGSLADLPWASVFDPAVNARALSAVQARGFKAATEVVNRFVQLADSDFFGAQRLKESTDSSDTHGDNETAQQTSGPDIERFFGRWQGMIGQLAQSLVGAASVPQTGTGSAMFDFVNANASGHVELRAADPGAVSTEVWLHNGGSTDLGKVRLRCSDLLSHDGALIGSAMVRFEPDTVPLVARSSRGVTVEVDVADDVRPGCYRGTLLVDGHADVWLPVVLTIEFSAS
jgi:hypothetical protein